MANINCIMVLTARGITEILNTGGSQAWRLDASHAAKYQYLVCVQNSKKDWGSQEAKHHHAFMVGRISGVSRAPESSKRWIINIDSYSEVDIPNQWYGNRNPVSYRSLEDIGIDVSKLEFKPVSKIIPTDFIATNKGNEYEGEYNEDMVNPLTIKDAKAGLALYFGVNQEDIQITIKG
ncbi:hypothetical protein H5A20_19630 [Pectobacterium brasiliense]|uniref:hypothetical protein n=1 Tax=Pectobacterium brasiliense TaxID=180957 RepID=UPI001968D31D|nr:hypothetical protein [Pectobacterium brasiliense]MBN3200898.1 hypothetical protein [Pectobacterium brasiliense]